MKNKSVTFEEPPVKRDERYDWGAIAEKLRSRPGEWAKIFDRDRVSLATAIRISGIKSLRPSDGFEVRTANNRREDPEFGGVRTCTLYLRYVPKRDTTSKES